MFWVWGALFEDERFPLLEDLAVQEDTVVQEVDVEQPCRGVSGVGFGAKGLGVDFIS